MRESLSFLLLLGEISFIFLFYIIFNSLNSMNTTSFELENMSPVTLCVSLSRSNFQVSNKYIF
jgi:hypothetical protein